MRSKPRNGMLMVNPVIGDGFWILTILNNGNKPPFFQQSFQKMLGFLVGNSPTRPRAGSLYRVAVYTHLGLCFTSAKKVL